MAKICEIWLLEENFEAAAASMEKHSNILTNLIIAHLFGAPKTKTQANAGRKHLVQR